jgi:hypothetical protein
MSPVEILDYSVKIILLDMAAQSTATSSASGLELLKKVTCSFPTEKTIGGFEYVLDWYVILAVLGYTNSANQNCAARLIRKASWPHAHQQGQW